MKMIFKIKGNEFRTPSLNGWQKLAVAIYKLTGIRTNEYKHIERVNEACWKLHCEAMQKYLDRSRKISNRVSYLASEQVNF